MEMNKFYSCVGIAFLAIVFTYLRVSGDDFEIKSSDNDLKMNIAKYHADTKNLEVVIHKQAFTLSLVWKKIELKQYKVVLGFNTKDDKKQQGDGCTPEGIFHVRDLYPHKYWSKFIWIDYPTTDSWRKYNENIKNGLIKKNTDIGGDIGIHGVPTGNDDLIDNGVNWTLGCISLKTNDINEVYSYLHKGSKITILK